MGIGSSACRRRALRFASAIALFLIVPAAGILVSAEPQDHRSDASEVLKRFSGDWQTKTRIHHAGPPPREFKTEGKAACRQTLEGRYFEFRTRTIPPGQADLQIMTYDVEAGVYRQWVFSSDGYRHEAQGKWNPGSSTLIWQGAAAGGSFVIEDRWVSPDRLEWSLRRTDSKGRLLQTIEGTLTRVTAR
jgi:hypothetical protein